MKNEPKKPKKKPIALEAKNAAEPKRRHGPEPERLKIDNLDAAIDKVLSAKRPPGGWPKP